MLDDRIAIIPIEDPERSKYQGIDGGIWIPEEAKQRVDHGIVKYRGPTTKDVMVGDHVVFGGYSGTKISVEGEGTLIIMREIDVAAILDGAIEQLFTLSQCLDLVDSADKQMRNRGTVSVTTFKQCLRSEFTDFFPSKSLEF